MNDKLKALIEKGRRHPMSPAEREAQHISFAYGNAKYENDKVTLDGIIRASASLKNLRDRQDLER